MGKSLRLYLQKIISGSSFITATAAAARAVEKPELVSRRGKIKLRFRHLITTRVSRSSEVVVR